MKGQKLLNEILDFITDFEYQEVGQTRYDVDLIINNLQYGYITFEVNVEEDEEMYVDLMFYKSMRGDVTLLNAEITQLSGELCEDLPNLREHLNNELTKYIGRKL